MPVDAFSFENREENFLPLRCYKDYPYLTLTALSRRIELAYIMLVTYIESPGRCGATTPQRLSFPSSSLPIGSYPELDLQFAVWLSCMLRYCCHTDPGSLTGTVHLPWYGYRKYL